VLAAWFRLKYPHIAIGALASSAPILQFDDITPWSSFYDAVSQDFKVSFSFSLFFCVCCRGCHFGSIFSQTPFFLYWKIILLIWAGSKLELLWSDKRELGRAGGTISSERRFGWTEQNFQSLPVSLTFYSYNPQRIKKIKYNSVLWNCVSCTDSAFDTSMVRENLDLSFGRKDNPTCYLFNLIYQYNNQLVIRLG
jgi:hypothetical protein